MWKTIIAFFAAVIAFLSSFFGVPLSDGTVENDGYIYKDMQYGHHERQVVDLYLPEDSDGEVGLVLYIHAGGWIIGDKSDYGSAPYNTTQTYGYAAAALNYRYISSIVDINNILDDITLCLDRIKAKAAEKGISINKVLLTGGSAGGHLSMLYAYARKDTAPIEPVAVVSYAGPTDLTDENYYDDNLLGDEDFIAELFSWACGKKFKYENRDRAYEELKAVSPVSYVSESTVPTVINHGMKDGVVPYTNALVIVEKFEEYGVPYDFNIYPDSNHDLGADPVNAEIADGLLIKYMQTYLGNEK